MRYLGGLRRQQPFVSVIALISVAGVALGVAALLVVLGVMSGFDADLEGKIIGANPHLRVEGDGPIPEAESLIAKIEATPGVAAASPYLHAEVLLQSELAAEGVILRGVDPERERRVTGLSDSVQEGAWPPGQGEVFLGSELSRRLGVRRGDLLNVVIAEKKPAPRQMRVAGTFTTGYYDYDLHLALASRESLQVLLGLPGKVSGVGVRLKEGMSAPRVKRELQKKLGHSYWVVSWMEMNRNLFEALKLEKTVMFILLTLIVLVACFNIIATLLMMVAQKTKEIGILKSIGATGVSIRRIFTWAGLTIGGIGTAAGTAIGWGLCFLLKKYPIIQLPADVYYIDRLPVRLEGLDLLTVVAASVVLSWLACFYPAWIAARFEPAEAIRHE